MPCKRGVFLLWSLRSDGGRVHGSAWNDTLPRGTQLHLKLLDDVGCTQIFISQRVPSKNFIRSHHIPSMNFIQDHTSPFGIIGLFHAISSTVMFVVRHILSPIFIQFSPVGWTFFLGGLHALPWCSWTRGGFGCWEVPYLGGLPQSSHCHCGVWSATWMIGHGIHASQNCF